jgi:hypothetical protein
MKKTFIPIGVGMLIAIGALLPEHFSAQTSVKKAEVLVADSVVTNKKRVEQNRNEMLNADNNTGPRQVNVGLPFGTDVLILENGVPIVYNFYPTIPTTTWRYDSSISRIGLLSFAEGALTFGKVGFVVDSYDREAPKSGFKGFATVYTNSFGSIRYDLSVGGAIGKKGWGYTLGAYESFDRGSGVNFMFTPWQDRTQIYKVGISKKYKQGNIRVLYKYSDAKNVNIGTAYYPFVYEGNGKFSPLPGCTPGSTSYIVADGKVPYYDPRTGAAGVESVGQDANARSRMHNVFLSGEHNFNTGWKLIYSSLYQAANSSFNSEFPISIAVLQPDQQLGMKFYYQGTQNQYTGAAQYTVHINFPHSLGRYTVSRAEISKKIDNHDVRIGATYQYNLTEDEQHNSSYYQTVSANPKLLDLNVYVPTYGIYVKATNPFGAMPSSSGGTGKLDHYSFSRLALYGSDDIKFGKRVELGIGGRIERQKIHDEHDPYTNVFTLNRPMAVADFKNKFNKVGLASAVVKITRDFGLLADVTYNSWYDRIWDYQYRDANGNPIAGPGQTSPYQNVPVSYETSVLNFGGGIYFNSGEALSLVSKVTKIYKKNVYTIASLSNPANLAERASFDPILYDISTLGWSTDIVARPFKGAAIHYLLTIQNPQYKNYSYSAFGVTYSYNNMVIPSLSKVLMEIDPSYTFMNGKMRAWVSLRYFGKQYGNPTNAFYYKPWWENFGGLDYRVSRSLDFKLQVTNFLDQAGIKGSLQGADQILSDSKYIGRILDASCIRPRTVEFTANFKF